MKVITLHPLSRRAFARLGLGALGASLFSGLGRRANGQEMEEEYGILQNKEANKTKQIVALFRYVGSVYYFDPIGLYVQPGDTVGFVIAGASGRPPTVTAYHPSNDNHELRIPENAAPFDSGIVRSDRRKPSFTWKFEVEGTYDYFSKWEEGAGMIGRIVVGKPGGPGEKLWGYGNKEGRRPIPKEVLKRTALLDSQEIVRKGAIRFPYQQFMAPYPLW